MEDFGVWFRLARDSRNEGLTGSLPGSKIITMVLVMTTLSASRTTWPS